MIEVSNISKTYKVRKKNKGIFASLKSFIKPEYEIIQALSDINFSIKEGEIIGYIGPNGAGKSTTIKIMSGILTPDSGTCSILGRTPWKERVKHVGDIGVVFGQRSQLWWDIPVVDSFELIKDIYKIDQKSFEESFELLKTTLDLNHIINTPVRQLSLGQRMRCEIAASLLHNPKILFLDEPTIGLDAVSKVAVRNFIKTINKTRNTTVILTTHDTSDIEALADRIILIGKGQVLFDGHLETIKNRYITHKTILIDHHPSEMQFQLDGVKSLSSNLERSELLVDIRLVKVSDVITSLAKHFDIIDITVVDPSIDDIIVKMYKEYQI